MAKKVIKYFLISFFITLGLIISTKKITACYEKRGICGAGTGNFICQVGSKDYCCTNEDEARQELLNCSNFSATPTPNPNLGCRPKGSGYCATTEFLCKTAGSGDWCCRTRQDAVNNNLACTNAPLPTPNPHPGCRPKGSGCDHSGTYGAQSLLCETNNNGDWCCQNYQAAKNSHLDCTNITPTPTPTPHCSPGACGASGTYQAGITCQDNGGNAFCCTNQAIAQIHGLNCHISNSGTTKPYAVCDQIPDDAKTVNGESAKKECLKCINGGNDDGEEKNKGIWTAVGCIKSNPTELIQALIRLGLGAAGGVALLSLLAGGFMLSVSEGDPKRVGQAKEMIVASLSGLLFIIFSVTLLQFIGWSILKIPGFGG